MKVLVLQRITIFHLPGRVFVKVPHVHRVSPTPPVSWSNAQHCTAADVQCKLTSIFFFFFLQLCPEDVKDFLEHMSVARINKGWEFMLPYDEDFVKKHPDIVQRQHMLWMGIQAK